ncbi:MAG TPA: ATP phosphoribosyltransferase regulatory subunit, partial [Candidatus Binatia bacterium]|nr:ATP phosphoribosyltransferase regulatory subunit [Candidatus Binatia bacterium]
DCKEDAEKTRDAPVMIDHLCEACAEHFRAVRERLDAESISVTLNPRMVRGLDYYCRTAFEVVAEGLGAQNAIGGGGRYDGLVASLGGPSVAGIGFALGVERVVLALHGAEAASGFDLFLAPLGEHAEARAFRLARELRRSGLRLEIEPGRRSLKSHMRRAAKLGAAFVLIVGDDELARGTAVLRDMRSHAQTQTPLDPSAIVRAVRQGKTGGAI